MQHVVIIGAGIGGLACALDLAGQGVRVTILEQAPTPGGKIHQRTLAGARIDTGPTVFTMRWVFDQLFADHHASLSDHLTLSPATILARHAWSDTERLDLFADRAATADAIAAFAGPAEARAYLAFSARARRIYQTLLPSFINAQRPTLPALIARAGALNLRHIAPFTTLWAALGQHFADPRLRQLFGRYATYCGASPYRAPATLMLVAHVEQEGVWRIAGGLVALAQAVAALAQSAGATLRLNQTVAQIKLSPAGRATAVVLATGEWLAADAIVLNGDVASLHAGLFGPGLGRAAAPLRPRQRSLSAVTTAFIAAPEGFPLLHHNVFFSTDYAAEFTDIFKHQRAPTDPTVYLCASDRADIAAPSGTPERLFCIVNAPAAAELSQGQIAATRAATLRQLQSCGLTLRIQAEHTTTPSDFAARFPGSAGALYGRAAHGPLASFKREGARSKIPGLYLAGGTVHPGPGVPMAALSGRLAAAAILADGVSTAQSRRTATPGGISTP